MDAGLAASYHRAVDGPSSTRGRPRSGRARGSRSSAAALKVVYTRVGSLAMLLAILALYLRTAPRTFELPAIVAANPFPGAGLAPALVLLAFVIAFAIKLPVIPFHSWRPDAHTEAPTAGSVLLAGVLLKLGGYGFLRIALSRVADASAPGRRRSRGSPSSRRSTARPSRWRTRISSASSRSRA